MTSYPDIIPPEHVRQVLGEASDYFGEADRRERNADERAKLIADTHLKGWTMVARAINDGFRLVAEAVRDNRR